MKTFEDYQEEMNPYYKDYGAFKNKSGAVCYIPENAESLEDAFTYSDLMNEVVQWKKDNEEYFEEHNTNIWSVLDNMFQELSWEYPSTFLDQLDY